MMHGKVVVGNQLVLQYTIVRKSHHKPPQHEIKPSTKHRYEYTVVYDPRRPASGNVCQGEISHRHGDGAEALIGKVLAAAREQRIYQHHRRPLEALVSNR